MGIATIAVRCRLVHGGREQRVREPDKPISALDDVGRSRPIKRLRRDLHGAKKLDREAAVRGDEE